MIELVAAKEIKKDPVEFVKEQNINDLNRISKAILEKDPNNELARNLSIHIN